MRHAKRAAAVCSAIGFALIAGVAALCLPLALPQLLGYRTFAIISGSMEPAIPIGSLVYAKEVAPKDLAVGDVVVYLRDGAGTPITHRVAENDTLAGELITKGDANAGQDLLPVPYRNVVGRVALHLPGLGRILPAFSTSGGKLALLGFLLTGVLLRIAAARLTQD